MLNPEDGRFEQEFTIVVTDTGPWMMKKPANARAVTRTNATTTQRVIVLS